MSGLLQVVPLALEIHRKGRTLARRSSLSVYDVTIVDADAQLQSSGLILAQLIAQQGGAREPQADGALGDGDGRGGAGCDTECRVRAAGD